MLNPINESQHRLIKITYQIKDETKVEWETKIVCTTKYMDVENQLRQDFERKGIFYHKIINDLNINLDNVIEDSIRLVSETICHYNSFYERIMKDSDFSC